MFTAESSDTETMLGPEFRYCSLGKLCVVSFTSSLGVEIFPSDGIR